MSTKEGVINYCTLYDVIYRKMSKVRKNRSGMKKLLENHKFYRDTDVFIKSRFNTFEEIVGIEAGNMMMRGKDYYGRCKTWESDKYLDGGRIHRNEY